MVKKISMIISLLVLGTACEPAPAPQPTPTIQTEIHLQAKFVIPELLEGKKPSHAEMDYLIYFPDSYGEDADTLWSLIVFLHGAGGGENDSTYLMSYGLPKVLYAGEEPEDFPFVVVSPQAFEGNNWWMVDNLAILNALIDEVIQLYQIDTSRIYLTGLSMGGYGSWHLAAAYPDRFAAMVSVSGSGFQFDDPGLETMCKLEKTPIWAIHGVQDTISDPVSVKIVVASLVENCDGDIRWTLYPDTGHGETFERAYRNPLLYTWMLEHSR